MQNPSIAHPIFGFTLHRHFGRHLRDHFIPHEGNRHIPHVLHHRVLFLYSLLLVLVKVSVLASPLLLPYNLAQTSAITSENIIALTNQSRTDYGLTPLNGSPKLAVAALNKARDMMSKGYFAHFSPDGVSPWFWIQQVGYDYSFAGENLAIRFSTAESVNAAWLQSAAHRANILSKNFTEIGVAVLTDEFGSEGTATLVVQMFGAPAAEAVPAKTETPVPTVLHVANVKTETAATISATLPAPEIIFPLPDSFVNQPAFRIIGQGEVGQRVRIYIDGQRVGEASVAPDSKFEYLLPNVESLTDGPHKIFAQAVATDGALSPKSPEAKFVVDTRPPQIFESEFSFLPAPEGDGIYAVKAGVSEDSIRTLVSVGTDSAELTRTEAKLWTGEIKLLNAQAGVSLPIQIYAQDMAGNEAKDRIGLLSDSDVKGVFSFVSAAEPKQTLRLFGGLVNIPDADEFARKFYLGAIVFLASALILNIAIKRHIQHPKTVAGAAGVMMLAMVLFVL
ncbi:MAG: CAP domain-containing protein [Patescibacteria group bacterium]|nr:CAP domain-containing protein [Patescibacteria group bacterium]